eukprot:763041-Hanusia_phi.AAC.2
MSHMPMMRPTESDAMIAGMRPGNTPPRPGPTRPGVTDLSAPHCQEPESQVSSFNVIMNKL